MWNNRTKKKAKLSTASMKLLSLPPINECFRQHVLRAHYQTLVWHSALEQHPPDLDTTCVSGFERKPSF